MIWGAGGWKDWTGRGSMDKSFYFRDMDKELTRKIAAQQTGRFFYSYPINWRRYQIMMVEKNLQERSVLFRC